MSKKLFGYTKSKGLKKKSDPATPEAAKGGPVVTALSPGAIPATLGDPRKRRGPPGAFSTILSGNLNRTLGG